MHVPRPLAATPSQPSRSPLAVSNGGGRAGRDFPACVHVPRLRPLDGEPDCGLSHLDPATKCVGCFVLCSLVVHQHTLWLICFCHFFSFSPSTPSANRECSPLSLPSPALPFISA